MPIPSEEGAAIVVNAKAEEKRKSEMERESVFTLALFGLRVYAGA
jgi:hypothetical protein